jgi:hypothetical protein
MRLQAPKQASSIILALALCGGAVARAAEHPPRGLHRARAIMGSAVSYAHGRVVRIGRSGGHYADLVGDPDSGLGFYPLPWAYRVGAWRARQRQAYNAYDDVRFAIMSQAIYSYAWPYNDNRASVFNVYDGYGTPFFAGYYGPGDPDAPRGPFGRPYRN